MIWRTAKLTEVNSDQSAPPKRVTGSGEAVRGAVRPAAIVAMVPAPKVPLSARAVPG